MAVKLGEMLVRAGMISQEQLDEALESQKSNGEKLGFNLIRLGYVKEDDITQLLSEQYGVPSINLRHFDIDETVINLIPSEVAQKYLVLPVNRTGATLTISMADPTNVFAMDDIKFMTGYNVEPVVASEIAIREAIEKYYGSQHALELKKVMDEMADADSEALEVLEEEEELDLNALEAATEEAPVVKLVNIILTDSIKKNASDIHIEPYEKDFRVRFRIDGVLYEIMHPPLKLKDAMTSRLKIMAKLDISEKRRPQDGKIRFRGPMGAIELRVATIPTSGGNEDVVMRILAASEPIPLDKMGFSERNEELLKKQVIKPYGIILVVGPTGSGKTTTLYSALNTIRNDTIKILTIEDPIEYLHAHKGCIVNQREIGADTENFKNALRYILRQDPDVVLIGELRDLETISIAVTAAEMGILVMGTLHTNGSAQTVDRIVNAFPADKQSHIKTMLSTSLRGVVSQPLLPTKGKPGRVAALEILINTPAVANLIRKGKLDQLATAMQSGGAPGMQTMDSALMQLVETAMVSGKDAYLQANDKSKFEAKKDDN